MTARAAWRWPPSSKRRPWSVHREAGTGHRSRWIHRLAPERAPRRRGLERPRRRRLHPLLRPGRQAREPRRPARRAALRARRGRPHDDGPPAAAAGCRHRLPPRRPAGGRAELRRGLRPLHERQHARHPARARGGGRGRVRPRRLGVVVVGVRRRGGVSDGRALDADAAALAVRRDEARLRGPRRDLPPRRIVDGRPALLHRLRAAPAPRHGDAQALRGAPRRRAVPAVRRRLPVARLHTRGRYRRRDVPRRPRSRPGGDLQRRRRPRGNAERGRRAARGAVGRDRRARPPRGSDGRRAPHRGRHDPGARRPRLGAGRRAARRAAQPARLGPVPPPRARGHGALPAPRALAGRQCADSGVRRWQDRLTSPPPPSATFGPLGRGHPVSAELARLLAPVAADPLLRGDGAAAGAPVTIIRHVAAEAEPGAGAEIVQLTWCAKWRDPADGRFRARSLIYDRRRAGGRAGIHDFPDDPFLPTAAAPDGPLAGPDVEVLRYMAARRITFLRGGELVGKVKRSRGLARSFARLRAVHAAARGASFVVVESVDIHAARAVFHQRRLPGRAVRDVIEPGNAAALLRGVGAVHAELHALRVDDPAAAGLPQRTRDDDVAAVRRDAAWVAFAMPAEAGAVAEVERALAADLEALEPRAPALCHGDAALDQVLLDDAGGFGLVDFDDAAVGDPYADLGTMVTALRRDAPALYAD